MSEDVWVKASEDALEVSATMVDGTLIVGEARSRGGRRRSPVQSEEETVTLLSICGQTETQTDS